MKKKVTAKPRKRKKSTAALETAFRKKWLRGSDCAKNPTDVVANECGIFTVGSSSEQNGKPVERNGRK